MSNIACSQPAAPIVSFAVVDRMGRVLSWTTSADVQQCKQDFCNQAKLSWGHAEDQGFEICELSATVH